MLSSFSPPPPTQFQHFPPNHVLRGQSMPMGAPLPVAWPSGFVAPNPAANGHHATSGPSQFPAQTQSMQMSTQAFHGSPRGLVTQGPMPSLHGLSQPPHGPTPALGPPHGSMGSMNSAMTSSVAAMYPQEQPPSHHQPYPSQQQQQQQQQRTPPTLPARNEVEMTRSILTQVLDRFSVLLEEWFEFWPRPEEATGYDASRPHCIRLVVHGGACMLLHPQLYALSEQQAAVFARTRGGGYASSGDQQNNDNMGQRRTMTRDVDFIARGFISEYGGVWVRGGSSSSYSNGKGRGMSAQERLRGCIHETAVMFELGEDWMNADADVALPMAYEYVPVILLYKLHHKLTPPS